ncbi:MAG TPA: DUF3592 domain-containing protein [Chloroflexia bacterium]|nr:DUF3592 domain-containing protein [Chloroflexia bacterium]
MKTNYKQLADQMLNESLEKYRNMPMPAGHLYALNPANQQFLNRADPHKQIDLVGNIDLSDLFVENDWSDGTEKPSILGRLGVAVLCLVIGLGAFYWIYDTFNKDRVLARDGVVAEAKVVDKHTEQNIRNTQNGTRSDTDYVLTYELTVDGGKSYRKSEDVSASFYSSHRLGGTVQVVYLPSNPQVAVLSGTGDQLGMTLLVAVVAGPLCLLVSIYSFWKFGQMVRQRRRLKKGKILNGRISHREIKNNILSKPSSVYVTYTFTSPEGRSLEGKSTFPAKYFQNRWHVVEERKPVAVLYLNDKDFRVM